MPTFMVYGFMAAGFGGAMALAAICTEAVAAVIRRREYDPEKADKLLYYALLIGLLACAFEIQDRLPKPTLPTPPTTSTALEARQ